jgi:hypothetical protein
MIARFTKLSKKLIVFQRKFQIQLKIGHYFEKLILKYIKIQYYFGIK